MSYEETVIEWARRKTGKALENASLVEVEMSEGSPGACDTCDHGSTPAGIEVIIRESSRHRRVETIRVSGYDLSKFLGELFEIGDTE